MGFFNIFGQSEPKIFQSKEEIRKALLKIASLDYKERPEVFDALVKELDHGGVNKEELFIVLRELREQHTISEIDEKNIKAFLT